MLKTTDNFGDKERTQLNFLEVKFTSLGGGYTLKRDCYA